MLTNQLYRSAKLSKAAYLPPSKMNMKQSNITPVFHTCSNTGADAYSWFDKDSKELTFSVRGTQGGKDILKDLDVRQQLLCIDKGVEIRVHKGFYDQFNSIEKSLMEEIEKNHDVQKLHFTGHSLGAAVASIAAGKIKVATEIETSLHTFGSPRVGNFGYAVWSENALDSHVRMMHEQDPVGRVPFSTRFYHMPGKHIIFDDIFDYTISTHDIGLFQRLWNMYTYIDRANPILDHDMCGYVDFCKYLLDNNLPLDFDLDL
jgi:hypothetical protein